MATRIKKPYTVRVTAALLGPAYDELMRRAVRDGISASAILSGIANPILMAKNPRAKSGVQMRKGDKH